MDPTHSKRRKSGGVEMHICITEVELLSFVCYTGGKDSKPRLWNIQNLGAVPLYPPVILPV